MFTAAYTSRYNKSILDFTHLPLDKMATILADDIFQGISSNETFRILMKISLTFVPKGVIDH